MIPTSFLNSACALICLLIAACANSKHSTNSSSEHSFASPSTIIKFFSVAAMINSKSHFANSALEGLITNLPSIFAILTSEIISLIGILDTANAADAAKHANESGITCSSLETNEINTCTSHK